MSILDHHFECPQCHQKTGIYSGESSREQRPDISEGLSGITHVQCMNMDCLHEWDIVTHRQILHSLSSWIASPGHGR
jgi:hypothetical protein